MENYYCEKCGKLVTEKYGSGRFCSRQCANSNRVFTKDLSKHVKARNGDVLDITKAQLENYKQQHNKCEICGKLMNNSIKWDSKFAAKNLCIDHDHETKKFRGLLCSMCNRQLGWYEKHASEINAYLNK